MAVVHVVAHIRAQPEAVQRLRALLLSLLDATRQEAGCIAYRLLQNQADPTDFTCIEEWADDAAIDAHMASAHVQSAFAGAQSWLAAAPSIERYRLLR